MKELVEVIAKALVDDPDSVVVTEREEKKATVLEVKVADPDMGKVIGKQGRIAKAIRSVVKAAAANGWIDEERIVGEMATGAFRSGAQIYLTYYAELLARLMDEGRIG